MELVLEKNMDDAIITLSAAFKKSGKNKKPVILHSIRVGLSLYNHGYDSDIVLSGILHDILEDTEYSVKELIDKYGEVIANIVEATSFNNKIGNKTERNRDMFNRCKLNGKKALLVKCADLIDNMPFIAMVDINDIVLRRELEQKYKDFIQYADEIKDELIFQNYKEMFCRYFP